jgi:hypothetical protein
MNASVIDIALKPVSRNAAANGSSDVERVGGLAGG